MAFNKGDVVQLKSGSPLMTVTNPSAVAGGHAVVSCTWFVGDKVEAGVFPAETLKLASTGPQSARPIR
jgi:uncharacterized protein YodC (DUF2158 family)